MPIKIRHLKNPKRGTEITFATIPIKDVESEDIYNLLSEEIGKFYESEGVNQDRSPVYSGGRTFSPPSHSEYSMGYWAGHKRSDKEVFDEVVKDVRKFIKSKEKEMIYPLYGKKRDDMRGYPNELYFLSLKKVGKKLLIKPQPFIHTLCWVTREIGPDRERNTLSSQFFGTLKSILESGFVASTRDIDGNAISKRNKYHSFNEFYCPADKMKNEPSIVSGDTYSIQLFPDKGHSYGGRGGEYIIERASPKRISSINIQLSRSASEQEKQEKMKFYQEQITAQHGIPVRFFEENEGSDEKSNFKRVFPKKEALEKRLSAILGIIGIIAGLFFLSSNITGNVIGNSNNSNISGVILLLIGFIGTYFYFKRK